MTKRRLLTVAEEAGGPVLRRMDAADLTGNLAAAAYKSVSGDPAVFSDGSETRLFREASARIDPVRRATGTQPEIPGPANIIPLVGRTGAVLRRYGENLFRAAGTESGKKLNPDGTVTDGGLFDAVCGYIPTDGMTSLRLRAICNHGGRANLTFRVVGYNAQKAAAGELYSVTGQREGENAADIPLVDIGDGHKVRCILEDALKP